MPAPAHYQTGTRYACGAKQARATVDEGITRAVRPACLILGVLCVVKEFYEMFVDCFGVPPCAPFDLKTCLLAFVLFSVWCYPYVLERATRPAKKTSWQL